MIAYRKDAKNSKGIRLGCTARKDDVVALYLDQPRDTHPRSLEHFSRLSPFFVRRRGISARPSGDIEIRSLLSPKHTLILHDMRARSDCD